MRQAMKVMRKFSESERNFLLYQNRLNAKLSENSYNNLLKKAKIAKEKERVAKEKERVAKEIERAAKEKEKAAKEKEKAAKEKERAAKKKALQKIEKLKKALLSQGIDPEKI